MRIGKVTENTLKRSVFRQIGAQGCKSAAVGTDCAFYECGEEVMVTSICPVSVATSNPGIYAVAGACNNILCSGAIPDMCTLSVLMPQVAYEDELKNIMADAVKMCTEYGISISGGHTEVTTAVSRTIVTASAVGHCKASQYERFVTNRQSGYTGAAIIMTKWIGLEGTAMLAKEKGSDINEKYPAHLISTAAGFSSYLSIASEAAVATKSGACLMHDVSSGGIFAALWELAQKAGTGLVADLKKIPVRQETIEITNFFNINPYELISGGALLIAADDPETMLQSLAEAGIPAVCIGKLTEGNDRVIINDGEKRFLEMPQADEILKVLG